MNKYFLSIISLLASIITILVFVFGYTSLPEFISSLNLSVISEVFGENREALSTGLFLIGFPIFLLLTVTISIQMESLMCRVVISLQIFDSEELKHISGDTLKPSTAYNFTSIHQKPILNRLKLLKWTTISTVSITFVAGITYFFTSLLLKTSFSYVQVFLLFISILVSGILLSTWFNGNWKRMLELPDGTPQSRYENFNSGNILDSMFGDVFKTKSKPPPDEKSPSNSG